MIFSQNYVILLFNYLIIKANDKINEIELKKLLSPCIEWIVFCYSKKLTNVFY
jgi:hypothetical protein